MPFQPKATSGVQFIENRGQVTDQDHQLRPDVLFSGEVNGLTFHLKKQGVSYQQAVREESKEKAEKLPMGQQVIGATVIQRVDIRWLGTQPDVAIETGKPLKAYRNFIYPNCEEGLYQVPSYQSIRYNNLYQGIDLHWYDREGMLEYDFEVAPGADPEQIAWTIEGATQLSIGPKGDLRIQTPLGTISEKAPVAFQGKQRIDVKWHLEGDRVSFELGAYQAHLPLIIDPVVRLWGTYYGGGFSDGIADVKSDQQSNLYTVGSTWSPTSIATSGAFLDTLFGSNDVFIAKFSSNGVLQWGTYYGGYDVDLAYSCKLDNNDHLFVTGYTQSAQGIASNNGFDNSFAGVGTQTAFLAKFNGQGARLWGTYYGEIQGSVGFDCSVDSAGAVYMSGWTASPNLGTTGTYQPALSVGSIDAFLVKFSSGGARLWCTYYGNTDNDFGRGCATDVDGNVYLVGQTGVLSTTGIASNGAHQTTFGGGGEDGFIAKFNASGVRLFGTYYGGSSFDVINDCATDGAGNLYFTGFSTSPDSIATPGSHKDSLTVSNVMLVKFDSSGVRQWGTYYGGLDSDVGSDCIVDPFGNVYVAGSTRSVTGIADSTSFQDTLSIQNGTFDAFVVKFSPGGVRQASTYYGGPQTDFGSGCTVDGLNRLYLCGSSDNSTNLATSGSHQPMLNGAADGYLVKFDNCIGNGSSITTSACSTYTSPGGQILISSGVYLDTLFNSIGCDSVLTINLTINNTFDTLYPMLCDSFSAPSGNNTWFTSGLYLDTLSNAVGCDSILSIFLTVQTSYDTIFPTACYHYTAPSGSPTWTQSGTYSDTLVNNAGCDSILSIHLLIQTTYDTIAVTACDSFQAPSSTNTWDSAGVYNDTLTNVAGCDSILTIQLMLLNSFDTVSVVGCNSYVSPSGNFTWTAPGVYQDTVLNSAGCDSILTLSLSLLNSYDTVAVAGCGSYTSPSGNYIWTVPGVYQDTIPNAAGCDSILTLTLSLLNSFDTLLATACSAYTAPSGNVTWTTAGSYTDTLTNALGCDSILTIHLTLLNSFDTLSLTACDSLVSPSGQSIWTTSGTFTDTLTNTMGCDSILTVQLTINNPADAAFSQTGFTLTANTPATFYQWLTCDTGWVSIQGAIDSTYTVVANGEYALAVQQNGCTDTSTCLSILNVSTAVINLPRVAVYPNPFDDQFSVDLRQSRQWTTLTVYSITGQMVSSFRLSPGQVHEIGISGATGVYILEVQSSNESTLHYRLLKR
ncbi:MAG: SBBP repeat-containing protein [Salibacteraceae bacterium]